MELKDKLNEYINMLACSAKELSESAGLSSATISRYRSGERMPEPDTDQLERLACGIGQIAAEKGFKEITKERVMKEFYRLEGKSFIDTEKLSINLNRLMKVMSISASEVSKAMNYDSSYISRIKSGRRRPSKPVEFAYGVGSYIARRYDSDSEKSVIAELLGRKPDEIAAPRDYCNALVHWLTNNESPLKDNMEEFLKKLDEFDLNEYIRAIKFDELKVPSMPISLPTTKSYYNLKDMMNSEIDFLRATVLSKSKKDVIMYSDMPMEQMAKDTDFPKKWMFGMAMMLKKGLHLHQVHNVNRPFNEMMLGLESWIPMYMTGQISPYYLQGIQNSVFCNFLKVSGAAALTGEAIAGFHSNGKYYLTKKEEEVKYYNKRAENLLDRAKPLMEIYRQDSEKDFWAFMRAEEEVKVSRRSILSAPPIYTISDELLLRILDNNRVPCEDKKKIMEFAASQRDRFEMLIVNTHVTDEIPVVLRDEFNRFSMVLSLTELFYEKDISYTYDDYMEHLALTRDYQNTHKKYKTVEVDNPAFRNLKIIICEGRWVLISKNKSPAIHFVIRHPKMRQALERFTPPIVEV